jgi:hypothetical protein
MLLGLAAWLGLLNAPVAAYVDHMGGFTLGSVVQNSPVIVVARVEKVSLEKRAIVFRRVADLKGRHLTEQIKHQLKQVTGACWTARWALIVL